MAQDHMDCIGVKVQVTPKDASPQARPRGHNVMGQID